MNAQDMMEKLVRHPVVHAQIGLQMQLGLPYLEKRGGKLCATFLPHREAIADGKMAFYTPQYRITWVYPFDQVVFFENRRYADPPATVELVQAIPLERYMERGRFLLNDLYAQCSHVLAVYERDRAVSDVILRKYQEAFADTVQALGLTRLYGQDKG